MSKEEYQVRNASRRRLSGRSIKLYVSDILLFEGNKAKDSDPARMRLVLVKPTIKSHRDIDTMESSIKFAYSVVLPQSQSFGSACILVSFLFARHLPPLTFRPHANDR